MFSFWEKSTFIREPDVVIIGSGIVGLSTALSLKERSPLLHVLILERGMLPYGASTRNAGFACYGSASELFEDLKLHSEDDVFSLVEKRWKGLQRLRSRIGDQQLAYEPLGGYELFTSKDELTYTSCMNQLPLFNQHLKSITGLDGIYSTCDKQINSFGFQQVEHLIYNKGEGQIDTGMMMQSLLRLAREQGIEVLNGAMVKSIVPGVKGVTIQVNEDMIEARSVVIATNGFAKQFLPSEDVQPARAQVLITKPIQGLEVKGSFHYDQGYNYFRNVGDRILLGGGRNLNFNQEFTEEMSITQNIQEHLDHLLSTMILPVTNFEIDMRWSGIMGLGSAKKPIIKKIDDHLFCAVRMGGMGIAIGSLVGEEVAALVLSDI